MKRPAIFDKLALLPTLKRISFDVSIVVLSFSVLLTCSPLARAGGNLRKPPATPRIGKIFVVSPKTSKVLASSNAVTVRYNVNDPNITSVKIKVTNGVDAASGTADLSEARVFLFQGMNTIELFGFAGSELDSTARATIQVECNSGCMIAAPPTGGMVQSSVAETPPNMEALPIKPAATVTPRNAAPGKSLALRLPDNVNAATVDSMVIVQEQSGIRRLVIDVYQNGQRVDSADLSKIDYQDGLGIIMAKLKIANGVNQIHVFDPTRFGEPGYFASSSLTCDGPNCVAAEQPGKPATNAVTAEVNRTSSGASTNNNKPAATDDKPASDAGFSTSGLNTRVVVGFEQAGGSSAESATKPMLDMFFTSPFWWRHHEDCSQQEHNSKKPNSKNNCTTENSQRQPRFGFWGDIRLAATPDQIAAAQVFPATLVNEAGKPSKSVDLVQSFDFLAGAEYRLRTANGSFLSLVPGVKHRTSLYFAAGGGAISPLTAKKEAIQILNIPEVNDARRTDFVNRYGEPPDGKKYLALTPVDRDRFLRQWYAGFRLKTLACTDQDCHTYRNTSPAIVDFMFGQNEAVTGGSLKRGGTPDPTDPTGQRLIGQKHSFVLRIDGFYPLPFKEKSFLFLYGSAMMKIGGGGVKVTTPLFLDNPGTTVQISDPAVFMPPTSVLKLQQPDRDYYKIGIGINLSELLKLGNKPANNEAAKSDSKKGDGANGENKPNK
jgi:hypothetical protein